MTETKQATVPVIWELDHTQHYRPTGQTWRFCSIGCQAKYAAECLAAYPGWLRIRFGNETPAEIVQGEVCAECSRKLDEVFP